MRFLPFLALTPLALAILAAGPSAAPATAGDDSPQAISVIARPGPQADAARKFLLKPYAAATATDLGAPAWDGSIDALTALATAHGADLALVGGPILAAGCKSQLFDKVDWSALIRDRFLPLAASDCGVGAYVAATVLAWDKDKLPATPNWGDFWDVAKHPGRRGLQKGARGNLEIALMADGVSANDIYRTLRSADGQDRAFRKLDQLKPYIVWWDQPAQPAQLLASAKVLLTSAPSAGLTSVSHPHVGVQWAGSLTEATCLAVLHGTPHARGAAAALVVATDPARQVEFARATGLGPSVRAAMALLPADARAQSPSFAANVQAGLSIDEGFWLDNGEKLEARFAAWVAK